MGWLKSDITRRDFLNGVALSVAAGALSPAAAMSAANAPHAYPPGLAGLRGSHAGAFEVAHALAWEGRKWARPSALTDSLYDLVVVGAGLSGLAAAHLFRAAAGESARILILDNHDDFGGHARRNEFDVDGRKLIGYGGSQSIDGPSSYSPDSKEILKSLGVDVSRFYDYFDQQFYEKRGMRAGLYLDQKTYGADALSDLPFPYWSNAPRKKTVDRALKALPLQPQTKSVLKTLVFEGRDYLDGKSAEEKVAYLRSVSYEDFLKRHTPATDEIVTLLRRIPLGLWGCGWDVLSALEASRWGMPGTDGLGVGDLIDNSHDFEEPYIFHFPDGNASLARLLVRKLIPDAVSGSTMEDIVLAAVDYGRLDAHGAPTRIRLGATAVEMRHSPTGRSVDVVYVKEGIAHRVRGRHAIMAGYMAMAPHICLEMPTAQAEAVRFFTKIPLVYVNVALRNWRAFEKAGFHRLYAPSSFCDLAALDFPVSMGDYRFSASPDEPILLHLHHVPIAPGLGLNEKDQHRAGRHSLYTLSFEDFETAIVGQLTGALSAFGFDAEKTVAGITVNRWPHGYAYEYNELFDGADWSPENGPHLAAREQIGRISIANSDSSAFAYVNGAFDAAARAVKEQLLLS
ncbi:MAG: NAD(P)-binding protein [Parvularculaceae bacterium]|nr:NAD(P)-binding protein [Parvularculaceae bacterium]